MFELPEEMVLSPVYSSPIRPTPLPLTNTVADDDVNPEASSSQPPILCGATKSPILTAPFSLKNTSPEQASVAVVNDDLHLRPLPVLLKTSSPPEPLAAGGIIISPSLLGLENRPTMD